jgi:hypothetical protein
MEVFVLMGRVDYEGDLLLGVYASEEEAVVALGVYTRDLTVHDRFYIDSRVLGAPSYHDPDDGYRRYL